MPEQLTVMLAERPVTVVVENGSFVEELRDRFEGFLISRTDHAWLTVEQTSYDAPPSTTRPDEENIRASAHADGGFLLQNSGFRSVLTPGPARHATCQTNHPVYLCRCLETLQSLLLPEEGALVLHGDAVWWRGGAYVFLGPSGTGKTTAAARLKRRGRGCRISLDRTVVWVGDGAENGPIVLALPRLSRLEIPSANRPPRAPLRGLFFPQPGEGLSFRRLSQLEAHNRLWRCLVLPTGSGHPTAHLMEALATLLDSTPALELSYDLDQDFTTRIEQEVAVPCSP